MTTGFDSFMALDEGTALTEGQIRTLINRYHWRIYQIQEDGPYAAAPYTEFGAAGHKMSAADAIAEYRRLIEMYEKMLANIPYTALTQIDDPFV